MGLAREMSKEKSTRRVHRITRNYPFIRGPRSACVSIFLRVSALRDSDISNKEVALKRY